MKPPESPTPGEVTPDYVADLRRLGDVLRILQELVTETREEVELAARNHQLIRLNRIPSNMQEWALRLLAEKEAEKIVESIACSGCDCDSPDSLAAALQEGWTELSRDDGYGWNYIGLCPRCL